MRFDKWFDDYQKTIPFRMGHIYDHLEAAFMAGKSGAAPMPQDGPENCPAEDGTPNKPQVIICSDTICAYCQMDCKSNTGFKCCEGFIGRKLQPAA